MIRMAILGASGFVGGELLRLCAGHPAFRPVHLYADSAAGKAVAEVHPHLALAYPQAQFTRWAGVPADVDLVFAALPHGQSQALAGAILDAGLKLVDLGADFRLKNPEDYARWYGEGHAAPALIDRFVYGLPELNRAAIARAQAVAAPGCYPTAAILALKPLVDAGMIVPGSIIVDAASGVSGAGKTLSEGTAFNTVSADFAAYGLVSHRHTAEIEQALDQALIFTPHLAPMTRGLLATCYGQLASGVSADPQAVLRAAYAQEPFIHVSDTPPHTKWVLGANTAALAARADPRTGRVIAIGAIDNLVKGAAGQMIQCANLMHGLDEKVGLPICGVYP